MNSTLVILQDTGIVPSTLARIIQAVQIRFPDGVDLTWPSGAPPANLAKLRVEARDFTTELLRQPYEAVVLVPGPRQQPARTLVRNRAADTVFYVPPSFVDQRPRVMRLDGRLEVPQVDSHVFTRLSAKVDKQYAYFPYGYMYRMTGMGPMDEFGNRIAASLETLAERDVNHRVVAVFGGSTTWSIDCLHTEMFTHRLEERLNADEAVKAHGLRFHCLNFGLISGVVLNELINYLLFAARIRPEIVIGHDGYNDLLSGAYTDPHLLQHHAITYADGLEGWGKLLHGLGEVETIQSGPHPYPIRSAPNHIVAAYLYRKKQFEQIVAGSGGAFIWGLQPLVSDKKRLAAAEQRFVGNLDEEEGDAWREVRKRVPQLMRMTAQACAGSCRHFVDFAPRFAELPDTVAHFNDTIHLTPQGDDEIARVYCDYIVTSCLDLPANR